MSERQQCGVMGAEQRREAEKRATRDDQRIIEHAQ
jgi:hypothetical protein